MTKKHFEAIAHLILHNTLSGINTEYQSELIDKPDFVSGLADYFQTENPRFDRAKFIKSCGVEQ